MNGNTTKTKKPREREQEREYNRPNVRHDGNGVVEV